MKFNISYPITGQQKNIEIKDEKRLRVFIDKRLAQEVRGEDFEPEFAGYIFRISGGIDKQGFPMKQGVLSPNLVRLLVTLNKNFPVNRKGVRKRKTFRGCIITHDINILSLVIIKKGEKEIPGLTDNPQNKRLGPKRAANIRKMFNLSKSDDVRRYVTRRSFKKTVEKGEEGEKIEHHCSKAPKIQRLITPARIQRKKRRMIKKKNNYLKALNQAKEYAELLEKIRREKISK